MSDKVITRTGDLQNTMRPRLPKGEKARKCYVCDDAVAEIGSLMCGDCHYQINKPSPLEMAAKVMRPEAKEIPQALMPAPERKNAAPEMDEETRKALENIAKQITP